MGIRFACDGCQKLMSPNAEPKRVGTIKPREYCDRCAGRAEAYMRAVNKAHAELAAQWQARLQQIREEFAQGCACLPDTCQEAMSRQFADKHDVVRDPISGKLLKP